MSYDRKCYDLALAFLSDCGIDKFRLELHTTQLAQDIQDTIEGYIDICELKENHNMPFSGSMERKD